jgi:hypothetical protein
LSKKPSSGNPGIRKCISESTTISNGAAEAGRRSSRRHPLAGTSHPRIRIRPMTVFKILFIQMDLSWPGCLISEMPAMTVNMISVDGIGAVAVEHYRQKHTDKSS